MRWLQHNPRAKTSARLLTGILAALVALILPSATAVACSCAVMTTSEHVDNADVVARVIVERVNIPNMEANEDQLATYTFRPIHVWKGDVVSQFKVVSEPTGAACGLEGITEGSDLVVFATREDEGLSADLCGGTTTANEALVAELVDVVGAGVAVDTEPDDEPGSWVWPAVTAVVALGLVGGVLLTWWAVPRRRE